MKGKKGGEKKEFDREPFVLNSEAESGEKKKM